VRGVSGRQFAGWVGRSGNPSSDPRQIDEFRKGSTHPTGYCSEVYAHIGLQIDSAHAEARAGVSKSIAIDYESAKGRRATLK